ncbi:hypothetical protein KIPB_005374, partial [Kipferlia bialata]
AALEEAVSHLEPDQESSEEEEEDENEDWCAVPGVHVNKETFEAWWEDFCERQGIVIEEEEVSLSGRDIWLLKVNKSWLGEM